uniref:Uncharacterized protein n=1 Tax=viral metagenome TaxID=1070528 RepID=A0A6M3XP34_9ZZZZ
MPKKEIGKDELDEVIEQTDEEVAEDIEDQSDESDDAGESTSTPDDSKDESDKTDESDKKEQPTLEGLQSSFSELEKKFKGQYKNLKTERQKRQDIEAKHTQLTQTLTEILEKRRAKTDTTEQFKPDQDVPRNLPIEFDDDGNAFVPVEKLTELQKKQLDPLVKKLSTVESALLSTAQTSEADRAIRRLVDGVVGQNQELVTALGEFPKAWKWLDTTLDQKFDELGIDPKAVQSIEQLVDVCDETGVSDAFEAQYGTDIGTFIRANTYRSRSDLKRALTSVASKMGGSQSAEKKTEINPTLKKIAQKASGLGNVRNAKSSSALSLDELAERRYMDLVDLPDEEWAKLDKLMQEDERRKYA